MINEKKIKSIVEDFKEVRIATICSHSSLQIFEGARKQGLKTIGICKKEKKKLYEAFPFGKPDEFIESEDSEEIERMLLERNAVLIPHGSLVEYFHDRIERIEVPLFGSRKSLLWERKREKLNEWMKRAHLKIPRTFTDPSEIEGPTLVKLSGAKGGKGYVVVNSEKEFREKVKEKNIILQEFITGVRIYPHYFYSVLYKNGYPAGKGRVELLGVDRRIESNADEIGRSVAVGVKKELSFTVVANEEIVVRESLLPKYLEMGKNVVESAEELFGSIIGPFCIETIIDENMEIYAFEISARIVAGTNAGSNYSKYIFGREVSMGERIAMEVKKAFEENKLGEVVS